MGTRQGNTQPAQYRLHWGAGYNQPHDSTHDREVFNHPTYSDKERRQLDRLKPGQSLDLTQHLPEGYSPRALVHTVTRVQ